METNELLHTTSGLIKLHRNIFNLQHESVFVSHKYKSALKDNK